MISGAGWKDRIGNKKILKFSICTKQFGFPFPFFQNSNFGFDSNFSEISEFLKNWNWYQNQNYEKS